MKVALLLSILVAGISILSLPARIHVGDPYTWREESRSLILRGQFNVEFETAKTHGEENQYFVRNTRNGRVFSKYGVMNGLLNVIPMYWEYKATGQLPSWDSQKRRLYLGYFAALLSALIAFLLYRISGYITASIPARVAWVLFTIYGTYLFHYLRASNTEAPQMLFFLAFFERVLAYRASGYKKESALYLAWAFLLGLILTKISFLLLVPVFMLALLGIEIFSRPASFESLHATLFTRIFFCGGALLLFMGWVCNARFGSPLLTGYQWVKDDLTHSVPVYRIVLNLFFTEQWGIPTHFPLLLFAPFGARAFYRRFSLAGWLALGVFVVFALYVGSIGIWKGEWAYGPRYFLFALPALSLPALLVLEKLFRRSWRCPVLWAGRALTLGLFAVSFYLNFQVARLDPFFYYWTRPPMACSKNEAVEAYTTTTHYGRLYAEAWAHRENPETIPWLAAMKVSCPEKSYAKYVESFKTWLRRTNFYWWSPRD